MTLATDAEHLGGGVVAPEGGQVVEAARVALRLPAAERAALRQVLAADVALLARLEAEITDAVTALSMVLADFPAGILATSQCRRGASVEVRMSLNLHRDSAARDNIDSGHDVTIHLEVAAVVGPRAKDAPDRRDCTPHLARCPVT